MENKDTGLLLNKQDIELHREYFEEMVNLIGIMVIHKPILKGAKNRNLYGEIDSLYDTPELVGCIFDEHPNVWTARKLGWNWERNEDKSIIHVPYNLKGLENGSLFIIPSPIDNTKGRVFEVTDMSTKYLYPASIACQLAPYIKSNFNKSDKDLKYSQNNFTVLKENEGDD